MRVHRSPSRPGPSPPCSAFMRQSLRLRMTRVATRQPVSVDLRPVRRYVLAGQRRGMRRLAASRWYGSSVPTLRINATALFRVGPELVK